LITRLGGEGEALPARCRRGFFLFVREEEVVPVRLQLAARAGLCWLNVATGWAAW